MDDWTLLRRYAHERSEEAFAELVNRHVRMVYSVAFRQARQNSDLAEEITQKTFCLLARKAASLPKRGFLVGWLYRATCNLSHETIRAESRRRIREENAAQMRSLNSSPTDDSLWHELAPLLDQAINALPEQERLAIVLRYFQAKPMCEVALAFGVSEEAAKMRVSRAVEKLRQLFAKRGIKVASLTLSSWLAERSSEAVPARLVPTLKNIPFQSLATVSSVSILSKALLFMAKMNLRKAGALALLGMFGLTVGVKIYQNQTSQNLTSTAETVRNQTVLPASRPLASINENGTELNAISLTNALENLKIALTAPWPNPRKAPFDRIVQALSLFGKNGAAAVPVLMEEFNKPPTARSFDAVVLAAEGLTLLGTDAASALPDLTRIFLGGEFLYLNNSLQNLFDAVDPQGTSVPLLMDALKKPDSRGSSQISLTIAKLVADNPGSENTYRPLLTNFLTDSNIDTRRRAAFILARLNGEKVLAAIPVLVEALSLESLRDPKAYDPIVKNGDTYSREGERFHDENWRLEAVSALREFGPDAKTAVPALVETAQLLPATDQGRRYVLEAIGAIDPDYRARTPEIERQVAAAERGRELAERAKQKSASFDELVEGLQNPDSVGYAAQALEDLGEQARAALPELVKALDQFNDYGAAQRIKELQPDLLVEQLKQKRLGGLNEIANALGELGPEMQGAVPYLDSILAGMKADDPNVIAVAEAIQKIDPGHPKTLYHFEDLHEATSALLKAIYDNDKTASPVYNAYITDFQDQNNVSRPQLLKFVEATKVDPDLYDVFVAKLLQKNPALASDLTAVAH